MLMASICDIFNYADYNTACCYDKQLKYVKSRLEYVTMKMISWFKTNEMKVNHDKFQVIIFSKNGMFSEESVKVDEAYVTTQHVVKLLGVTFDNMLTFDMHVDEICRKAGRKLSVLGRLSTTLDVESKLILFHSFVLSHFEYCSVIWHFCSREKMKKVEKIQKQALRYVFNDYTSTYQELLKKADITLLYVQRVRSLLCVVNRCLVKAGPAYLNDMFTLNEGSNSRKLYPLVQHKYNTTKYGKNSVMYQGSRCWNRLDHKFKFSTHLKESQPKSNSSTCDLCVLMQV
jgi:hypothetical protein